MTAYPPHLGEWLVGVATANVNSTADQAFTMTHRTARWIPTRFIFLNATLSLTTVQGGIYSQAAKAGTPLVPATQAYTALTAAGKYLDVAVNHPTFNDWFGVGQGLFVSFTTAQGAAGTVDIIAYGKMLSW